MFHVCVKPFIINMLFFLYFFFMNILIYMIWWASPFFDYFRSYWTYRAQSKLKIFLWTTAFRQKKELRDWMSRSKDTVVQRWQNTNPPFFRDTLYKVRSRSSGLFHLSKWMKKLSPFNLPLNFTYCLFMTISK